MPADAREEVLHMGQSVSKGTTECLFCAFEAGDQSSVVAITYQDADWKLGVLQQRDVPGWLVLWLGRHKEGLASLSTSEAESFGRTVVAVAGGIQLVTGCSAVYLAGFFENNPHVHVLIAGRPEHVRPEKSRAQLLIDFEEFRDRAAAIEVAQEVGTIAERTLAARGFAKREGR
jgi:diadenosine tetraphosphate (Ap4A) HIT family hydrolase